jgi:hypothetical protein
MFCPNCRDEFRDGISFCPDCDVALVPELPDETPARLSIIVTTQDPDRLAVLVEQLESARVPYVVEAGTALSLLEDDSAAELSTPEDWKARLWVPGDFAARAAEMVAETAKPGFLKAMSQRMSEDAAEQAVPDDEETVDVGEAATLDPEDLKNPVRPR